MDENGIVGSIDELARHFGKSARSIQRWVKDGMPRLPDGRFDLLAVTAWRRRRKGSDPTVQGHPQDGPAAMDGSVNPPATQGQDSGTDQPSAYDDKDYWDKISKKEQALKRQMERKKLEGELVERKLLEDMFIARILEVKTLLLSFERLLPPELIHCRTDRDMSEVIRKFTRRALSQFSRPLPKV